MNKFFLSVISFLIIAFHAVYPADTVVQTIGLDIGKKSVNYNIDRVLKKVLLSVSVSNKKVNVVSSDKDDLEMAGVGVLNGSVLLKTEKKPGYYQIVLYEFDPQTGKTGEKFDDSLKLYNAQFSDTVDDVALKVIDRIAVKFPPKPLRELTKIDMIKVKLSEYESPDGYWSLTVTPVYDILSMYFSLSSSNDSGGDPSKYFIHNGGDLDVEAVYRLQQWTFGFGASGGAGNWSESSSGESSFYYDFYIRGIIGYGLFGSLIVLGLEPKLYRTDVSISGTTTVGSNVLPAPNVQSQRLTLGIFIVVNISKDYNISASAGIPTPLLYVLRSDFSKSGANPLYNDVNFTLPPNSGSDGMNYRFKFNFRIAGEWWLNLFYENVIAGYNYESGSTVDPNQYYADAANQFRIKKIGYSKTRIGLGVRYDF